MPETITIYAAPIGDVDIYWRDDRVEIYLGDYGAHEMNGSGLGEPPNVREAVDEHSLIAWAIIQSALADHFQLNRDHLERAINIATKESFDWIAHVRDRLEPPSFVDDSFGEAKKAWAIAEVEREEAEVSELTMRVRAQLEPNDATQRLLRMLKTFPKLTSHLQIMHRDKIFNVFPNPFGSLSIHTDRQRVRTEFGSVSISGYGTLEPDGSVAFEYVSWGGLKEQPADRNAVTEACREILSEVVSKLMLEPEFRPIMAWISARPRLLSAANQVVDVFSEATRVASRKPAAIVTVETENGLVSIEHVGSNRYMVRGAQGDVHLDVFRESGTKASVHSFQVPLAITSDGDTAVGDAHFRLQGNKTLCRDSILVRQVELLAFEIFQRHRNSELLPDSMNPSL